MSRQTIDFGIDLGTTNSSIAVFSGTATQVFMNHENLEYTPSAVWMDPSGNTVVGRRAKEQTEKDRENAFSEFKLQMGTTHEYVFARTGRKMRAEELSAGVLKDLRDTVRRRSGEEVTSAVVTVPAAFELPQCEATKRAAELAGFSVAPLLQEPVALLRTNSSRQIESRHTLRAIELKGTQHVQRLRVTTRPREFPRPVESRFGEQSIRLSCELTIDCFDRDRTVRHSLPTFAVRPESDTSAALRGAAA